MYLIPFDQDGNMLTYDLRDTECKALALIGEYDCIVVKPEYANNLVKSIFWCKVYEFTDTLTYVGYTKGRSACNIVFTNSQGKKYYMFMSEFDKLLNKCGLNKNKAAGTFSFVKRGANYSLAFVKGEED